MNQNISDLTLRLQAIIDTAIDGILTIDRNGIIESVNNAAAAMFQYEKEDLIGRNVKMLMPDPYHSQHDGYIHRYLETKEARIIGIGREVKGRKRDETIFPLRLAVSEVILNDRIIFTGIVHDLTVLSDVRDKLVMANEELETKVEERTEELEKAVNNLLATNKKMTEQEEELKTSLAKEKELSELKSRFVSMASHEFRTPLSTIMSSASLISRYTESDQNEKRIKHVERIKSAVGNLTGILNDFLSLSKLEEGKVGLNIEDLNMSDMCRIVNEDLEGLLKKGQRINHKSIGEFRILKTDKRILKNVLFNIVSNAVKYSGEGDLIECRVQYGNEDLEISIVDEGIGIPENEQKHLFDRFFRASNVETIQGTGLGLNIVKQYVKLLKGSISFKSIPQKGTTFTIRLPYRYEENTGHRG